MTDDSTPELSDELVALLRDDAVWAELDTDVTERTIAAVMSEASGASSPESVAEPIAPVTDLASRRPVQWSSAALGAAAALLLVVGGVVVSNVVSTDESRDSDIALALEPTQLEPDASGNVEITATPNGTKIILETFDLPPAPDGTYYEAWLRSDDGGVSAGTFHMRGGGGTPIELWAGVTVSDFPLFTVTLQPIGMVESSGEVVLIARLDG